MIYVYKKSSWKEECNVFIIIRILSSFLVRLCHRYFFFLILECTKRSDYSCRVEIKGRSFNTNFDALDNHNRTTLNPLIPLLLATKRKCCCEQSWPEILQSFTHSDSSLSLRVSMD